MNAHRPTRDSIPHTNQKRGDTEYYEGGGHWARLAAGSSKQVLSISSGIPAWASLDNTYLANRTRTIWLPAGVFVLEAGTPTYAIRGASSRYSAWDFDAATAEAIDTEITMPADYVSAAITYKFHWTNLGAGAGNVVWQAAMRNTADTADLNGVASTTASDTIAAPAQDILKISTSTLAFTPIASNNIRVNIRRVAADAADTLANDAGVIGIEISYTADS